jgi:hypothetical protein
MAKIGRSACHTTRSWRNGTSSLSMDFYHRLTGLSTMRGLVNVVVPERPAEVTGTEDLSRGDENILETKVVVLVFQLLWCLC